MSRPRINWPSRLSPGGDCGSSRMQAKAEAVWPLLQHSPDPRLRSFLINWLEKLGAGAGDVAAETVGQFANPSHSVTVHNSPLATQSMDAILFQPETSIRRALILALGTYGPLALPSAERIALTGKLLDLYKNDPDAGVHGAAEWTLRQWHEQSRLQAAAASLPDFEHRGERRWFVSKARPSFVLIQGPLSSRWARRHSSPTDTRPACG